MKLKATFFLLCTTLSGYLCAQTANTWVSGSNAVNQAASYGTQGVGSTSNIPGARFYSTSWTENDTLWLFGGIGYDASGNSAELNGLWKYNKVI